MKMRQRHLGRELALQWLFQIDVGHQPVADVLAHVPDEIENLEEEGVGFAQRLVHGVLGDQPRIDETIERFARGWPLTRMAAVERNLLRMAMYELLDEPDIPASVSVDEAVEIAKKYGADESGKFVNGILGAFIREEKGPPTQA